MYSMHDSDWHIKVLSCVCPGCQDLHDTYNFDISNRNSLAQVPSGEG